MNYLERIIKILHFLSLCYYYHISNQSIYLSFQPIASLSFLVNKIKILLIDGACVVTVEDRKRLPPQKKMFVQTGIQKKIGNPTGIYFIGRDILLPCRWRRWFFSNSSVTMSSNSSFSLAAQAVRASDAHRNSSLSSFMVFSKFFGRKNKSFKYVSGMLKKRRIWLSF